MRGHWFPFLANQWPFNFKPFWSPNIWLLVDSLIAFYYIFTTRDIVKICVFHECTQPRFTPAVFEGVLRPLQVAWYIWQCPCLYLGLELHCKARIRAFEAHSVNSRSFKDLRPRQARCQMQQRRTRSSMIRELYNCPPGKPMTFLSRANRIKLCQWLDLDHTFAQSPRMEPT